MSNAIEEAKVRLRIPELWVRLNVPGTPGRLCRSPFREDKKPSFSIFDDGLKWKDFATGETGDAIDFLARARGLSNKDAISEFLKLVGIRNGSVEKPRRKTVQPLDWPRCVAAFTQAMIVKLAQWRGFSLALVQWLSKELIFGLHDEKFAIAVRDSSGKVVSCHKLVDRDAKIWKYVPEGLGTHPLFFGDPQTAGYGLAFESQWDMFAAMDLFCWNLTNGLPDTAMFCTRGSGNGRLVAGRFSPDATVYAVMQNDLPDPKTGKIPAEEWLAKVIANSVCKVLRLEIPAPHHDLNDWKKAGATREDFEAAMKTAKLAEPLGVKSADIETGKSSTLLTDQRPKVRLPGDNYLLSDFAREVGSILATKNIFSRGGLVFVLNERRDGLALMTAEMLRTWIETYLVCFKVRSLGGNESIEFKRTISQSDAAAILASQQFIEQLQPLEKFNTVRVPVLHNGNLKLLREGYDKPTKSYTANSVPITDGMPIADAKAFLDDLLGEFSFADSGRSKSVVIAAMLTVFGRGLLPPKSLVPCFIFLANAEGAGKTLLVKCCTIPFLGYVPTGTRPRDEDELRKFLLAAVVEARLVIFFDNGRQHIASESLEAFLTTPDFEGRVLGQTKTFRGANNSIVFITGNGATVSPDMRRRSLFCELFIQEERPEDRVFKKNLEVPVLLEQSPKILTALWALIQNWYDVNRPNSSRGNSSFSDWSNIIGGIVENAGFGCPLETPQIDAAVDTDGEEMRSLVVAIANGERCSSVDFEELLKAAREGGLFERIIPSDGDLDAKARSTLGKLFKRYDRRLIGDYRFSLEGKGHGRKFKVEQLNPSTTDECSSHVEPDAEAESQFVAATVELGIFGKPNGERKDIES